MIKITHICDLCGASEEKASDMELMVLEIRIIMNGCTVKEWHACQSCRGHILMAAVTAARERRP